MKHHRLFKLVSSLCALALVAGTTTPMISVYANDASNPATSNGENRTSNKIFEQRSFTLEPKGDHNDFAKRHHRTPYSYYSPTGILVEGNDSLTVTVAGSQSTKLFVQSYDLHGQDNGWHETTAVSLQPGTQVVRIEKKGMVYLQNMGTSSTATIQIQGGSHYPVVEQHHTKADFDAMLAKYPHVPYVDFVSEKALATATYDRAKKFVDDPQALLKNWDIALNAQEAMNGYDRNAPQGDPNEADPHRLHMMEARNGYMYMTHFRSVYGQDSIKHVINNEAFVKEGWGPWHENGHFQQNRLWRFEDMGEVQVNIYSLAAQIALGQPTDLETRKHHENGKTYANSYERVFEYLALPSEQKNYDQFKNANGGSEHFLRLVMLWQLHLGLGENFYPQLNRAYRDLPESQQPNIENDEEVKQLFMVMSSKVSGLNLLPFFDQWGLRPSDQTRQDIQKMNFPVLSEPIWEGTDSNPVKANVEIPAVDGWVNALQDDGSGSNNQTPDGEPDGNSNSKPNSNANSSPNSNASSSPNSNANSSPNSNANSNPNSNANSNPNSNANSNPLGVSIQFQNNQVTYTLPTSLHRGKFRVMAFQNGTYIGESYENRAYYSTIDRSNPAQVGITPQGITLKKGDKIELYLMEDRPGSSINKKNAQLLATATY